MVIGHKIKKKVEVNTFLEMIQEFEEKDIRISPHSFFRFNEKQRETYNQKFISEILLHETPFLVGIQNNGLWALFYKYKKEIWRIIVDFQIDKIYIVTFYKINREQIPKI